LGHGRLIIPRELGYTREVEWLQEPLIYRIDYGISFNAIVQVTWKRVTLPRIGVSIKEPAKLRTAIEGAISTALTN